MDALNKVVGVGKRKEVMKFLKNKATLQFLSDVLQPILDIQDNSPIVLRIGRSSPPQYRKFVPYLAFFSVDNAGGYCICCCTPGIHKCRQCELMTHVFDASFRPKLRTSTEYEVFNTLGEPAWVKKIMNDRINGDERNILSHNKSLNISNVQNPLHAHFRRGERNLFASVPFDTLHTLHKGLLQQVFMWTISVIELVGRISRTKETYKNCFMELDKRIDNFPRLNSVSPWGPFK